jgi:transcriptional regulator with XRE-family HTH domain
MADLDLKLTIAGNITNLRKSMNWTQTELARQLNYSDKAISKWERAESIPDITVLNDMAGIFQVPISYLLETVHADKKPASAMITRHRKWNHIVIALISAAGVFFIATLLYVIFDLIDIAICEPSWMIYIYAIPLTLIVLLVFNLIWGKRNVSLFIISLLIWSILISIYLSFSAPNMWLVFLIGIPAQIIVLLVAPIKIINLSRFVKPRQK